MAVRRVIIDSWPREKGVSLPSAAMELEIVLLLRKSKDIETVGRQLLAKWKETDGSPDELSSIADFFINSGLYSTFLAALSHSINNDHLLPWAPFIECLGRNHYIITPDMVDFFFNMAASQNLEMNLCLSHALDNTNPKFDQLRKKTQQNQLLKHQKDKAQLYHELELLQSERLFNEEIIVLEKLRRLAPNDPQWKLLKDQFDDRLAIDVISKSAGRPKSPLTDLIDESFSDEQNVTIKIISEVITDLTNKNPNRSYNFAMLYMFLGCPELGLPLLKKAPSTKNTDWLLLEVLLQAKQFLEAVNESLRLEQLYKEDPESTFAAIYARALALKGLNQAPAAIELLKSIVNIRPNYRSAHSLLQEWKGARI